MSINFYTKPPKPIPEVEGIIDSIDSDTYEKLVKLVVEDHGCLFPQTLKFSYTLDFIPSYKDLIEILINRKESRDAIMTYEENLYFRNAEEQDHIFRSLYLAGCDEQYIIYLMTHCDISTWDISMKLISYWDDSKQVEERKPEFLTRKRKDKRAKPIREQILDMRYADRWFKREEGEKKEDILAELNKVYHKDIKLANYNKIITKYR